MDRGSYSIISGFVVQCMIQLFLGLKNRVCTIRESQGKKCPFHFGQGKSWNVGESQGNLQWSGEKIAPLQCRSEKMSLFIITEVFDLFCLHLKFILL